MNDYVKQKIINFTNTLSKQELNRITNKREIASWKELYEYINWLHPIRFQQYKIQ